jgi:hypothetical protein
MKNYRGVFSKTKFMESMKAVKEMPHWAEVADGCLVDEFGRIDCEDYVFTSFEVWELPLDEGSIKKEEEFTLFLKDFLWLLLDTEYIKIIDDKNNKVYYGGKVEDLAHTELIDKAKNMWLYGKVSLVRPTLMSINKVRKMGVTITVDVSGVSDIDD